MLGHEVLVVVVVRFDGLIMGLEWEEGERGWVVLLLILL